MLGEMQFPLERIESVIAYALNVVRSTEPERLTSLSVRRPSAGIDIYQTSPRIPKGKSNPRLEENTPFCHVDPMLPEHHSFPIP